MQRAGEKLIELRFLNYYQVCTHSGPSDKEPRNNKKTPGTVSRDSKGGMSVLSISFLDKWPAVHLPE